MAGGSGSEPTTRFRVDITELRAGIQEANRQIRLVNAQFNAATAGMDDWAHSADGISAKLTQLRAVLIEEERKLDSLRQQYTLVAEEQGENSRAAQDLMQRIYNQEAAVGRVNRSIREYATRLEEMTAQQEDTRSSADRLSNTISEQQRELDRLKDRYRSLILEQGEGTAQARELQGQIQRLSREMQVNQGRLSDAAAAADELDGTLEDAGESAETAGNGGFSVLKGALSSLVADGIRKVIDAIGDLMVNTETAMNSLASKTGIGTTSMEKFQGVMEDLYKANYGESLQDISDVMGEIMQQTGDWGEENVKDLTKQAIILRDTFGYDVKESMRAVNMLMQQFGISGKEAFDLVARGAQVGLDKNGDMLDTINEYSVHYNQMGVDAVGFFQSLENGSLTGTFSIDKLGDAYKEFGIRVKDTATSTDEAYQLLNMDAEEMRMSFSKGGESAQQATQKLLEALFSMDDKVKQNQAGVGLFGTMWEDLGIDGVKALTDITNQTDSFYELENVMQNIDSVRYGDLKSQFEEIGRSIKVDLIQPIVEELSPEIHGAVNKIKEKLPEVKKSFMEAFRWIMEHGEEIVGILVSIGVGMGAFKIAGIVTSLVRAFQTFFGVIRAGQGVMAALNVVMAANPIGIIIALIAALVAGFIYLWNTSDGFREFWINLWEKVKETVSAAASWLLDIWEKIKAFFTEKIPEAFDNFVESVKKFIDSVTNWFRELPGRIYDTIILILAHIVSWGIRLIKFATNDIPQFVNMVIDWIATLPERLWNWLLMALAKVVQWGINLVNTGREKASEFITNIIEFIKELPGKLWTWLAETATKVVQWGIDLGIKGREAIEELIQKIVDGAKSIPGKMVEIGKNLVQGFWDGITSLGGWIGEKVSGFFSGIADQAMSILDIHSPSRVFAKIGKNTIKGFLVGIEDEKGYSLKGTRAVFTDLVSQGRSILAGAAYKYNLVRYPQMGAEQNQTVLNFYQTNNSPKALSRLEIYRQTGNLLAYAKG